MEHPHPRSAGQDIYGLRMLIRRHLLDRDAIKAGRVRLIYFVDAHELKAYIHGVSSAYLEGFELGPERTIRTSGDRAELSTELRLKCEEAIRWLLFSQPHPVILLPPHGVEIEEEIAFQRQRDLARDLGLLADARIQLRSLRDRSIAQGWIAQKATQALRGDQQSKEELTAYLARAAPALGAVLNILPTGVDSIRSRIVELVRDSRLKTLGTVRWDAYGLTSEQAELVRGVGLDEMLVHRWQKRIEARRSGSERSNRLDAEAIAFVEKLNATLATASIAARGVLVTHTGTLIHATRDFKPLGDELLGADVPIRHVRLLAWDVVDNAASSRERLDDQLGLAAERLQHALELYKLQIDQRSDEAHALTPSEASALMEAWTAFENARSALGLAARMPQPEALEREDALGRIEIERLLEWLQNEQELENLIASRLSQLVVNFGREVLTSDGTSKLQGAMRCVRLNSGTVQLTPISTRMVGPVELQGLRIAADSQPRRLLFPDDGFDFHDGLPRTYLMLSLLHACGDSLALAEVYAKAAIDGAQLHQQPALAAEAQVLVAQLSRMTAVRGRGGDGRTPDEVRQRLDSAYRLLTDASARHGSPRYTIELAALHLERLASHLDSDETTRQLYASGLDTVESAFAKASEADLMVRLRACEVALAYGILGRASPRDYGATDDMTRQFIQHWHQVLTSILVRLRAGDDPLVDELPLLTRAIEVIGYAQVHADRVRLGEKPAVSGDCGIPNDLSLGIHSVQRGLSAADDRVSQQLASILADINARSGTSWTYSFVHAPVWNRSDVERATAAFPDAALRERILTANQLLHRVGDDQRILLGEPDQIDLLHQAKRRYSEILQEMPEATSEPVRFLAEMEFNYACLLESSFTTDPESKHRQLQELASRYATMRNRFGPQPTLLYRQSIVLGELQMHEQALEAIQQALNPPATEMPLLIGASWMRSTIRRRIGLHFSRQAREQLEQLEHGASSEVDYERYRHTIRLAFQSTFEGFDDNDDATLRGKTERLRRLNNLVFHASLFVEAGGAYSDLDASFSRQRLRAYLHELKAEAPTVERDWVYAHTIGAAHFVLNDVDQADAAADALLGLLAGSGASTQVPAIRSAIEDAFKWKRMAAGARASASGTRR